MCSSSASRSRSATALTKPFLHRCPSPRRSAAALFRQEGDGAHLRRGGRRSSPSRGGRRPRRQSPVRRSHERGLSLRDGRVHQERLRQDEESGRARRCGYRASRAWRSCSRRRHLLDRYRASLPVLRVPRAVESGFTLRRAARSGSRQRRGLRLRRLFRRDVPGSWVTADRSADRHRGALLAWLRSKAWRSPLVRPGSSSR